MNYLFFIISFCGPSLLSTVLHPKECIVSRARKTTTSCSGYNVTIEEVNSRKDCFNDLVQHVRHNLIKNRQFLTVSKLSAVCAKFQVVRTLGIKTFSEIWSKNLGPTFCFIINAEWKEWICIPHKRSNWGWKKLIFSHDKRKDA